VKRVTEQSKTINFSQVKDKCAGMLEPEVYESIYHAMSHSDDGDIVEVGTARGAATIALAFGIAASARPERRVISFDRLDPQNYIEDANVVDRTTIDLSAIFIQQIRDNIAAFEMQDKVVLHFGAVENLHSTVDDPISGLLLDADGAIDRDFKLFYNMLRPGSPVIIDDFDDSAHLWRWSNNQIRVDLKHRLTHQLGRFFIDQGLLEQSHIVRNTFFGQKPHAVTQPVDFNAMDFIPVYRSILFSNVERSEVPIGPVYGTRAVAVQTLQTRTPGLYKALRRIMGRTPAPSAG
jgi:predicted O-methyltransferase YrrM